MTIEPDNLIGFVLLIALAVLTAYRLGYMRGRRRGTYDILEARAAAARARPLRARER
jgi:hypothetical protein